MLINFEAILLFVDYSKTFNSIQRGKIEQILQIYGFHKEAAIALRMPYKNTKREVCSPDEDTDIFTTVTRVLQGGTFMPYLLLFCLDYIPRISIYQLKENEYTLKKVKSKKFAGEKLVDIDCADNLVLLSNIPAQAEYLLHSLE